MIIILEKHLLISHIYNRTVHCNSAQEQTFRQKESHIHLI